MLFILQFVQKSSQPKNKDLWSALFSYLASKIWNSLPDTYKMLNFQEFKQEILRYEAFPQ